MGAPDSPAHAVSGRSAVVLIAVLCVAIFVGATTSFAPLALQPFIAAGLGSSVAIVGQMSSVSIFLGAIMAVSFGTLIRRHGYRRLYVAGALALGLSSLILSFAPRVEAVLVAALLAAFANAIIVPVALAIAATEFSPRVSQRAMSYQIACIFIAVAVGVPGVVFVAGLLGWRGAFGVLAIVAILLVPLVAWIVPVGGRDPAARLDLGQAASGYREIFRVRSLAALYAFLVLYVLCSFGSGAYVSALLVRRGAGTPALGAIYAVAGTAFVISSVAAGELLGRLRFDLRFLILAGFPVFILARALIYVLPVPLATIAVLVAVAQLVDGTMAVAMRALVAGYPLRERALSMVLFSACESLGQAVGGVAGGFVLAFGGYPAIGQLIVLVAVVAFWLPLVSRRLSQPAQLKVAPSI
jgi:predicted MFS family arabinose efflux permease